MSLLNLIHKNIVVKFSDAGKEQYSPQADHVFRLDGVDAMGFLLIREVKRSGSGEQVAAEAVWINKDLVREIHEFIEPKAPEPTALKEDLAPLLPIKKSPKQKAPRAKAALL
jgi:hypothetical protein